MEFLKCYLFGFGSRRYPKQCQIKINANSKEKVACKKIEVIIITSLHLKEEKVGGGSTRKYAIINTYRTNSSLFHKVFKPVWDLGLHPTHLFLGALK